jgi:hypothetical protein
MSGNRQRMLSVYGWQSTLGRTHPMENASFLRRQAEFCLRLCQLCPDDLIVDHLTRKAAQYHEKALRTELEVGAKSG